MMLLLIGAGTAAETRQLGERYVHAERGGTGSHVQEAGPERGPNRRFWHQITEEELWRNVGRDRPRPDGFARSEHKAGCAIAVRAHAGDFSVAADLGAIFARTLCHGLRDRAHPAHRVTPHTLFAVHLAEAVVEQHVGRAGGEWRCIG